jgi:hypothetical protein
VMARASVLLKEKLAWQPWPNGIEMDRGLRETDST